MLFLHYIISLDKKAKIKMKKRVGIL